MMLWDIIRDWFVTYVFGGFDSNLEPHSAFLGIGFDKSNQGDLIATYSDTLFPAGVDPNSEGYIANFFDNGDGVYLQGLTFGDWLSTTATIITLIALCLFLFLAVKWVFNVFRNTLERVGK